MRTVSPTLALFSSWRVARSKRIFHSSCLASSSWASRSASERARISLMSMLVTLLDDELGVDRQLVARKAHRLAGDLLGDASHLEHDPARLDDRHPVVGRALARAQPDLGGLLGDRLVWE